MATAFGRVVPIYQEKNKWQRSDWRENQNLLIWREGLAIRMKLRLEVCRCKSASKWVPGRCSAIRVMSFEVVPVSTAIHVFVRARSPVVEAVSPGVVIGSSSRAKGRLSGKEMLTSSGVPVTRVGRLLMAP